MGEQLTQVPGHILFRGLPMPSNGHRMLESATRGREPPDMRVAIVQPHRAAAQPLRRRLVLELRRVVQVPHHSLSRSPPTRPLTANRKFISNTY